jgi:putative MATE family efflux protein
MKNFISRKYDRTILALALPALGSLAIDPLVTLMDTIFVGRLGEQALGALGVNAAIFSLAFFIFNFLAYGTTPMISRALGDGDRSQAGQIAVQALFLALILGTFSLIALQIFAVPIVTFMGAGGALQAPTLSYLRVRALAAPAVLLITAGNGVFRGFSDTRTPFKITVGLNLVNLILDVLFIFGFGWGVAGAAAATLVAQWLGAFWFVWLIFQQDLGVSLRLKVPGFRELAPFLSVGWQLALRTLSLLLAMAFATSVAARIGVTQVAAHQVAMQIWLFLALMADALAIAAQTLVARAIGEGDVSVAKAVAERLLALGFVAGGILAGLFWLGRPLIPQLFSSDPNVIATVTQLFPLMTVLLLISAVVFVWDGIFIGLEDFGYLALAMVLSAALSCALLLMTLMYGLGLGAVWVSLIALMLARGVTLAARFVNFTEYRTSTWLSQK